MLDPTSDLKGDFAVFTQRHLAVLEADPVRFNILVASITSARDGGNVPFHFWSLGQAGSCAIQFPGRPIVLGAVDRETCTTFAREVDPTSYPGVNGPDQSAIWFTDSARALGVEITSSMAQCIHVLEGQPTYPLVEGSVRPSTAADADFVFDWVVMFCREVLPLEAGPQRSKVVERAKVGGYRLWVVDDRPVSLGGIGRSTSNLAAIAPIFTPPQWRGHGFAGAVTAALCDEALASGRRTVCLYTDLANRASNRCYHKVGFRPYCDAWNFSTVPKA